MALFDRSRLLSCANCYFQHPHHSSRNAFLVEAHAYSRYLARSAARKSGGSRLGDLSELTEDSSAYAVQALIAYIGGPKLRVSDWASDPLAFVTQYLKSRITDYLRAELRRTSRMARGATMEGRDPIESLPSEQPEMADAIHSEFVVTSLGIAIRQLPPYLQVVYQLRFEESVPPRQIASALGISVEKVYQRVAQLKLQIRGLFDQKLVA